MQVYYGTNFWGNPDGEKPLKKIEVNKEYVWDTISGFIPAVYIGDEGICIDLCTRISNDEVQIFYDKWKPRLGTDLTEEEYEQADAENPLQVDFHIKVAVNGVHLENDFSCGSSYSKVIEQERKNNSVEAQLMQEYGCDDNYAWYFKRHQCKWDGMPAKLESVDITFIAQNRDVKGTPIEIGLGEKDKQYMVIHPVTQENYTIKVCGITQQEVPEEVFDEMTRRKKEMEFPRHYLMVSYVTEPNLPENEFRLVSAKKGDSPKNTCSDASSVGIIIGHTDGPTSVFIAGKKSRLEERIAASAMYFEPVTKARFQPVFSQKERADMELHMEL